jgi:uncharacterized HhH-GPD family protein
MPKNTIKHIDYLSVLEGGGLVRMFDRFKEKGTLTGDPDLDEYLRKDPNAVLLGLLYDQRIRAEIAFAGPKKLQERLGHLDMERIAKMDHDELVQVFLEKPVVHRFAGKMAEYTREVARIIAEDYKGNAANIWNDGADYDTIRKRIRKLPGFGKEKAEKLRFVVHYFGYQDFSNVDGQ